MDIQKFLTMSLTFILIIFAAVFPFRGIASQTHHHHSKLLLAAGTQSNVHIPTPAEDTIITKSIKTHINQSVILSRFNIGVKTDKGVVTLTGHVDSNSQASSLIELAQSIIGVRNVQSQLTVAKSGQVLRDTVITAQIKGLFIREGIFGPKRGVALMNVETRNGVVHLTGTITDKNKIARAIQLIQGVNGVTRVEYKLSKVTPHNGQ